MALGKPTPWYKTTTSLGSRTEHTYRAYLGDLSAFMIASQQSHMRWISSLQQHEQGEGFQAVVSSVDKVPHENVVRAGNFSACLKQLEQIMELTMDVPTNLREGVCAGCAIFFD